MGLLLLLLIVSGTAGIYGNIGAGCVFIGISIMLGLDSISEKIK
jgi:hypothetical protein